MLFINKQAKLGSHMSEKNILLTVSMIRKKHTHKLQTDPWHCEEEPDNNHETPGRQTK